MILRPNEEAIILEARNHYDISTRLQSSSILQVPAQIQRSSVKWKLNFGLEDDVLLSDEEPNEDESLPIQVTPTVFVLYMLI